MFLKYVLLKLKLLTSYMSQIIHIPGKADVLCHFTVSIFSSANLNYDTQLSTPNYMHTLEKANFRKHFRAFI